MKPTNKEAISKRIRQLRDEKNMTLEEWSALFGSNKSAGSKWENGTVPYRKTLEKMAELSGVSVDWILYGEFVEYVTDFVKQFPTVYDHLTTFEAHDYLSNVARRLKVEGKTYGDDNEILMKLLKSPQNRAFIAYQPEIQEYLKNNKMEIRDLHILPVDNLPEYRFHLINKLNDLLTSEARLPEYDKIGNQEFPDINKFLESTISYLIEQERLLKEWKFNINENASEEIQEHQRKVQSEMYVQASLITEMNLIEMMGGYMWQRDRVAEKYGIDVASVRSSRHLPRYEIKRYDPEPLF